jgi:D-glycero-alpha-D-manno-heptose-7-phosphate kinase
MIITRTPFRISFAGGGSDIESFYKLEGGAVLSTAINKYMYISVMERFGNTFRVSYSRTELRDEVEQIEHPIVRQCLQQLNLHNGLEIVSMADLPAATGMGSSSSFTVGLLHALHAFQSHVVTAECLKSPSESRTSILPPTVACS